MSCFKRPSMLAVSAALLALSASQAHAEIIAGDDFDSYSPGPFASGPAANGGSWSVTTGTDTIAIQNAVAESGPNALQLLRTGAGGIVDLINAGGISRGDDLIYTVDFDMFTESGNGFNASVFFGIGDGFNPTRLSLFAPNNGGNYTTNGGDTGIPVITDEWVNITIDVDLNGVNDTASYHIGDNAPVVIDASAFRDDFGVFRPRWVIQNPTGASTYIDNVSVSRVPEPASLALWGIAAVLLVAKRRLMAMEQGHCRSSGAVVA